jgi:hypothetical protein
MNFSENSGSAWRRRIIIAGAGNAADKKAILFRTSRGHDGTVLSDQPMAQADAWRRCASASSRPAWFSIGTA